jgi:hypothetical protein
MHTITDHQLASSILDNLGYTLYDLSEEYGGMIINQGDVSHQLFFNNVLMGYVWLWGTKYHTSIDVTDRLTPELAALTLLPKSQIDRAVLEINFRRSAVPEYF